MSGGGDPVSHRERRVRISQPIFHRGWQNHFFKQRRKNFDMSHREQIIDWANIGDDELHPLQPQSFKAIDHTAEIFKGVVDPDVMGFHESVELVSGTESEEPSQFILGETAVLVFLQRECLKRPARQIAALCAKTAREIIRNFNSQNSSCPILQVNPDSAYNALWGKRLSNRGRCLVFRGPVQAALDRKGFESQL